MIDVFMGHAHIRGLDAALLGNEGLSARQHFEAREDLKTSSALRFDAFLKRLRDPWEMPASFTPARFRKDSLMLGKLGP